MSSRISRCFARLAAEKRTALIPYVMAGDPCMGETVACMHALVAAGADLIELGIPFSDPMADGPIIQAAAERALAEGVTLTQVLLWVDEFRQKDANTPIILMGYLNPFEQMGYTVFADAAQKSGVDAVLTVDLPVEEADEWCRILLEKQLDRIFLVAPTTDAVRMRSICQMASGYVYYVSLKGVTGANTLDIQAVSEKIREIRLNTHLPVVVGFGIKQASTAAAVACVADGVVVGSALVDVLLRAQSGSPVIPVIDELIGGMRQAMDAV